MSDMIEVPRGLYNLMRDTLRLGQTFREIPIVDDEFPLYRNRFDGALGRSLAAIAKFEEPAPKCLGDALFGDSDIEYNGD
jgi:hypothetical protein